MPAVLNLSEEEKTVPVLNLSGTSKKIPVLDLSGAPKETPTLNLSEGFAEPEETEFERPSLLFRGLEKLGRVLEPLRTPIVGLGGIYGGIKSGSIQKASESIKERTGLAGELVGKEFAEKYPVRTGLFEAVIDPTIYIPAGVLSKFLPKKISPEILESLGSAGKYTPSLPKVPAYLRKIPSKVPEPEISPIRTEVKELHSKADDLFYKGQELKDESVVLLNQGDQLYRKDHKLWSESKKLWGESDRLLDESNKLLLKSRKIRFEANQLLGKSGEPIIESPIAGKKISPKTGFVKTVAESPATSKEFKEVLKDVETPQEVFTNQQALKLAEERIAKSADESLEFVLSEGAPSAEKTATAISLLKKYEIEGNYESAKNLLRNFSEQGREMGRGIQALTLWNRLSPSGLVKLSEGIAKDLGREIPENAKKLIFENARKLQLLPEGAEKNKATLEILSYIADQLPSTKGEIFDAFRYQNMLSNPRSHERNIYGNLLQTFITRPLNLLGEWTWDITRHPFNPISRDLKLSNIPIYYQAAFKSIPEAVIAFKEGIKSGRISQKVLETGISGIKGETVIETLRRQNLPKSVTMVSRLMEAQDNFFSVLIGSGEKASLMARGVSEEIAEGQAKKLAERYLYRSKLGTELADLPTFARALDGLGKMALQARSIPTVGKVVEWFVPFVTTPINIAKMGIEVSPLGFIGGGKKSEQMGKALIGSVLATYGGILALQDKTTWLAPKDPKSKKLFYESGRKPMSIEINGKWTPLLYLGPYAIPMAMASAVKYYSSESKEALSDSQIEKLTKIILGVSRIITEQTPLSGISTFLNYIGGDDDISVTRQVIRTMKQVIPFQGFLSYLTTVLDPVYRKSKTFEDSLKVDFPLLSKDLPAHRSLLGGEAKRNYRDFFLPYSIGMSNEEFSRIYKQRIEGMQKKHAAEQEAYERYEELRKDKNSKLSNNLKVK